nr:MAG TPA: hypothetical protein [Herelleviridae sp.]
MLGFSFCVYFLSSYSRRPNRDSETARIEN